MCLLLGVLFIFFFFFKQKTAYELRISDWSSDVCSSDPIAFDLDGTLAESKRPLSEDMAATLARLLAVTDVAVISGGDWPQFEKQVASRLPAGAALDRLWLMPTTGTKLYRFINGAWRA